MIAHDPSINLALRSSNIVTPFVLFHKSGVTRELYDYVSITIQSGIGITDIERLLINLHKGHHTPIRQCSGIPYFEINKRFPGQELITWIFLRSFLETEEMYWQHISVKCGK